MANRKRVNVKSGQWINPWMIDFRMICCDCGLVHSMNFKVIDENGNEIPNARVSMQGFRNEPHTKRERKMRNITMNTTEL
jgi:hypothetical protein